MTHPKTILIIEDEPALVRGLRDNIEAAGHHARTATDGDKGLAALLKEPPDLVLLDIMLPSCSGYEICAEARRRGLETPIIMLTAKGQEDDIIRGLNAGADDYVTKPFSIRELLARISAFLRRHAPANEDAVFGDFLLDRAARRLLKNDEPVPLTAKEYKLLDFFLKRPGRAVTRDGILDAVWGDDVIVTDRSVDRCVATLRGKIEASPHRPTMIRTVRDIGYRFDPPENG